MSNAPNPYAAPAAARRLPPLVANVVIDDASISIDYELEVEDLTAMSLYFHHTMQTTRHAIRLVRVLFGILALAMGLLAFLTGPDQRNFLGGCGVVFSLLSIVWPWIHRWRVLRTLGRVYREGSSLNLFGPRRMVLTRDYVLFSSPISQTIYRWVGIQRVDCQPEALYLTVSAFSGLPVPRRAFANEGQFEQFAKAAQEYFAAAPGRTV